MRVSVITTVYNGQDNVRRCYQQIASQTCEDWEYVWVDDGSTDGTAGELGAIAELDPRVRIIKPGRVGRARALNLAVAAAEGEFVAQQDVDDISYPDRLATQVAFLSTSSSMGVCGAHYVLHDDRRGERYVRKPPSSDRELRMALARYIPIPHTLALFRRKAWASVGGYPLVADFEDARLWIAMAREGWRLGTVPVLLGEHRVHDESYWHREFSYASRQRSLAKLQMSAVGALELGPVALVYPLARLGYAYLPSQMKRVARRLAGVREDAAYRA